MMNKGVVYALWGYEAQNSDELSFHEGDAITVLRRKDENETEWWWARLGDQEGYVPKTLLGVSALSLRSGIRLSCYSSTPEHVCKSAVGTLGRVWGHVLLGDRRRGLPFPTPQLSLQRACLWSHPMRRPMHAVQAAQCVFLMGNFSEHPDSPVRTLWSPEIFLLGWGHKPAGCHLCHVITSVLWQSSPVAGLAMLP